MRLQKHDLYMTFAKLASFRSTCYNHQEGAVVLINNQFFIGYTGNLPKQKHCAEIYNETDSKITCNCNNAELNAIFQLIKAKNPVSTYDGAILYTTDSMDVNKASQLVSAGITEIVYGKQIEDNESLKELKEFAKYNNLKLVCYEDEKDVVDDNVNELLGEIQDILLKSEDND